MPEPAHIYNPAAIEAKWQRFWKQNKTFKAIDCDYTRPKLYVLDMFPVRRRIACRTPGRLYRV